jgi:folate-dependent phosphoribosylglycinamide formyltransferase PurN
MSEARLKVAILTMPGGGFVVHHLVKHLDVLGIVVDEGPWVSATSAAAKKKRRELSTREKLEYYWLREGAVGAGRAALRRLLGRESRDPWAGAAREERRHLERLDAELVGHPFFAKRVDLQQFADIDAVGRFHGIPVVRVQNANDDDSKAALRRWAPDLGIICSGRIIKPAVIEIPRLGLLNKHSAILPKHRGLSAEYWCLYYEDFEHLGLTVHFVKPGLDDGNILVQKRITFEKGDTPDTLRVKSELIGRDAIVEAVRRIEATGTRGEPQDESKATHNPPPTLETDRALYAKLPRLWEKYGA